MMAYSYKPDGLSIGGRAWSKVLVTIHRKHLVGETGALTYLLADHLEMEPTWLELYFVINNLVDWRGHLTKVTVNAFIGNLLKPICDYSIENSLITIDGSHFGCCCIELSDPESINKFCQAIDMAINTLLDEARYNRRAGGS